MSHTHKDDDDWKRERNERAVRDHLRKITDPAMNRMRSRTAKEQLADAIQAGRAPNDVPDAEDESTTRTGVLS